MQKLALAAALSLVILPLGVSAPARAQVTGQGTVITTKKVTIYGTVTSISNVTISGGVSPNGVITVRKILGGTETVYLTRATKFQSFAGGHAARTDLVKGAIIQVVGLKQNRPPVKSISAEATSPIEATKVTILID